ncbi:MAG: hypothetical protein HQ402_01130 [Parcubacteria group bacterium]|nr:hypothetical protein [Parcubacteria group bacterium]
MEMRRRETIALLYLRYAVKKKLLPVGLCSTASEIAIAVDFSSSDIRLFLLGLKNPAKQVPKNDSKRRPVVPILNAITLRKQEEMAFVCLKHFCARKHFPFHTDLVLFAKTAKDIGVSLSEFLEFWKILGHELVDESFTIPDI